MAVIPRCLQLLGVAVLINLCGRVVCGQQVCGGAEGDGALTWRLKRRPRQRLLILEKSATVTRAQRGLKLPDRGFSASEVQ